MSKIVLRIDLDSEGPIGPGKIRLLEHIRDLGSISAAARAMNMSYRHAWVLIDSLNRCFGSPVVHANVGGKSGGGATLTPLGHELVRRFRVMEAETEVALGEHLAALKAAASQQPGRHRSRTSGRARPRGRRPR